MARANTQTLLSLDRFAQIIGMHPLTFNQISVNIDSETLGCGHTLYQYAWQKSRVGREDIARAIATAEQRIGDLLRYDVAPKWNTQDLRSIGWNLGSVGARGYIIEAGIEAKTLIDDVVAIGYSDEDGDGYKETATVTANVGSVTDPQEIAVYYPGEVASDAWEIRPTKVSIASGVATIVFQRHQAVIRDLIEAPLNPDDVDGLDDDNFLTTVDVYRHYNDPTSQANVIWDVESSCDVCSGDTSCVTCGRAIQTACMQILNRRTGRVQLTPASYDADNDRFVASIWSVNRDPNRAQLYYRAGYYDANSSNGATPFLTMSRVFEDVVARYALSLLPMPICDCGVANALYDEVRKDLSDIEDGRTTAFSAGNTLGRTAGALDAWHVCEEMRIGSGVLHA